MANEESIAAKEIQKLQRAAATARRDQRAALRQVDQLRAQYAPENLAQARAEYEHATFAKETARLHGRAYQQQAQSLLIGARTEHAKQTRQTWYDVRHVLLPLGGGLLLFYFLIGPGLSAILRLIGSLNIWLWIGGLLAVLWVWRSHA